MVVLEDSPISIEELQSSVSDNRVLGDLPDQGPPFFFFLYPSPDQCLNTILSRSSTKNSFDLYLFFALTCIVNCGTLHRQACVCAFPNYVQSIEFTTGGLKDDQWKQDAPELNFKSHSKGSEYLCKSGMFIFIHSQKFLACFHFVIQGYFMQIDEGKHFNRFQNKAVTEQNVE